LKKKEIDEFDYETIGEKSAKEITTSQIRKLLTGVIKIANKLRLFEGELTEEIKKDIEKLRIQFIYQAGRHEKVQEFDKTAKISKKLKEIQTKEEFEEFHRFIEGVVAYHRYYGGKD